MHYIKVEGKVIELTPGGRLVNPSQWNEKVVEELAKMFGIEKLTTEHFLVINCLRSNNGASSNGYMVMDNLRKVVPDWRLFKELFPKGLDQACNISNCDMP